VRRTVACKVRPGHFRAALRFDVHAVVPRFDERDLGGLESGPEGRQVVAAIVRSRLRPPNSFRKARGADTSVVVNMNMLARRSVPVLRTSRTELNTSYPNLTVGAISCRAYRPSADRLIRWQLLNHASSSLSRAGK
jgi:hypothetical protein